MKVRLEVVVVIVGLLVTGCAPKVAPLGSSASLGTYQFDYLVEAAGKTGTVQVFDDCQQTYIQLYPTPSDIGRLTLSADGKQRGLSSSGGFLVTPGLFETGTLRFGKAETTITRQHSSCFHNGGT